MLKDVDVRRIANAWHGGEGSALYVLASTGAIDTGRDDHDTKEELVDCVALWVKYYGKYPDIYQLSDLLDLHGLLEYVEEHTRSG